jgi:alkylated DNA repair protein alkB family protein 6
LDLHQAKEDGALNPEPVWRILQEPRSLLITTEGLYSDYLHGIDDIEKDINLSPETVVNWELLGRPGEIRGGEIRRGLRTSLTYRDVLKISRLGKNIGLLGKR